MELMRLGKDGSYLAVRHGLNTMDDVLSLIPWSDQWDCSLGNFTNSQLAVTAILRDGSRKELEMRTHIGYAASHAQDYNSKADSIGIQIAGLDVTALILTDTTDNQNHFEETEEYLQLTPIDWGKLRRRVEDALRKSTDRAILFEIAQKLNCKIS